MNLLFLVLIVAGLLVVEIIPVDVYPDVDLDVATIETFWPGASAEDVERLITDKIEARVADLRGLRYFLSDSKPDLSYFIVNFKEDMAPSELDDAFSRLRAAVDRVTDLPSGAEKPLIRRISLAEVFPLMWVAVEDVGGVGEEVLHNIVLNLKPILRDIPGVSKIDDKLIRERELHILVDRSRIQEYDLTLEEVAASLQDFNRNVPSGHLPDATGELEVRAVGEALHPEQLGAITVRKHPSGAHVHLRDIARIEEGFERKTFYARFNGNDCKALSIAKTDEADSRVVAERVREAMARFETSVPEGVRVNACLDTSDIIKSRMRILVTNLCSGIVLVFLTLWLVMGVRNALLAIVGIPFAFLCSVLFMHLLGVTINAVSLFAMVLCSGMIVDDAIVVLENIYRHVEENRRREVETGQKGSLHDAIITGTSEVLWPVISSSMTTVVAFLPMLLMGGVTGKFFSIIPKTVTVVLFASLVECLLILPVHYLDWGPRTDAKPLWSRLRPRRSDGSAGFLLRAYERFIVGVLRYRYLTPLPLFAMAFLAFSVVPLIPVDLFPSDYQMIMVDVVAWDEASLDQTGEVAKPIEGIANGLGTELVESVLTSVGLFANENNTAVWRNNRAQLHVKLANSETVAGDPDIVTNLLRERIEDYMANHPDSGLRSYKVWAPQDGPPVGKPVAVRIEAPDLGTAKRLAERYRERLQEMPGVFGIGDNLDFGPQQINLRLREDEASAFGLTQANLARALRTANDGVVVSSFKDNRTGEDLDVRVVFDKKHRRDIHDLLDVETRTGASTKVRLRDIADIEMSQSYAGIPHHNDKRAITVTAQIDTQLTTAKEVNRVLRAEFDETVSGLANVRVTHGGEYEETSKSFDSLKRAYLIALIVIYVLLATQFRSYSQPLVIILAVPFSAIGVIGGLVINDYPFTITTFIAIVGLTGVVVNDSIVLVDFINRQRDKGLNAMDAIRSACILRVRPILLTTITTVLGLMPLALGWGGKSKIWSPFASSFAWGLAFSTVVTLVLIPAFYMIATDVISLRRKTTTGMTTETSAEPVAES